MSINITYGAVMKFLLDLIKSESFRSAVLPALVTSVGVVLAALIGIYSLWQDESKRVDNEIKDVNNAVVLARKLAESASSNISRIEVDTYSSTDKVKVYDLRDHINKIALVNASVYGKTGKPGVSSYGVLTLDIRVGNRNESSSAIEKRQPVTLSNDSRTAEKDLDSERFGASSSYAFLVDEHNYLVIIRANGDRTQKNSARPGTNEWSIPIEQFNTDCLVFSVPEED